MRKIVYFFAIFASAAIFAQQSNKETLVIVEGMLASNALVKNDQKNVKSTKVYQTPENIPQNLKGFEKLASNGLTEIKVKELYYDRISLGGLNEGFKLPANNPVYFDGNRIEDTAMMVISNALENMQVEVIDGRQYLSLSTVAKPASPNAIK